MIFYVVFGDFFGWDWGTPAILRQNPNKITVLYGCGFKNLGVGQTPTPLVGTKSQLLPKNVLKASLMRMWILFPPMLVLLFRGPKSWQHLGAGKRDVQ